MKKIIISFLMLLCLCLASCGAKEVPAEVTILNEKQEEVSYQINKTDNPTEVKEIFDTLKKAKINSKFNGCSLDCKTTLGGKVIISNQEVRTIDLGYTLDINAITNLKKFIARGSILLDGYTNTDSNSLFLQTKNKLSLDFINDDFFAYLKGSFEEGNNRLIIKDKVNISEQIMRYKPIVSSYIDVIKYYNPLDFIPNLSSLIDKYHIIICNTTKDTFTLRVQIPAKMVFKRIDTELILTFDLELSCSNLLPICLQFQADEIISQLLENEYVEQYISSTVEVEKAKLTVEINLKYDIFEVEELTEEEKTAYKEYIIPGYDG